MATSGGEGVLAHHIWGQVETLSSSKDSNTDNDSDWRSSSTRPGRQNGRHSGVVFHPSSDGSRDGRDRDEPTPLPTGGKATYSAGAETHNEGKCKPCAWNWKPNGCIKGVDCTFCHMCAEGTVKTRRKERVAELKADRISQLRRDKGVPLAAGQEKANEKGTSQDAGGYAVAAVAQQLTGRPAYSGTVDGSGAQQLTGAIQRPSIHHLSL